MAGCVEFDRKSVRRTIKRGFEPPRYGPRKPRPRLLDPFTTYLRERVMAWPGLTGARLTRELRELGYTGGYTAVTDLFVPRPRRATRSASRRHPACRARSPSRSSRRSAERRVGKECVSTCRYRGSPFH